MSEKRILAFDFGASSGRAMICTLKEKGVECFDLGGLGLISSPSISHFKLGVCDKVFEYCGDYISI